MAKRKTPYSVRPTGTHPQFEDTLRRLAAGEELKFLNHSTGYEFPNGDRVEYKTVVELKRHGNICDTAMGVAHTTPEMEKEKERQRTIIADRKKQARLDRWKQMIRHALSVGGQDADNQLDTVLCEIGKEAMSLASLSD